MKLPARPRRGRREHTTHRRPDRGGRPTRAKRQQNVRLTGAVPVGIVGDAERWVNTPRWFLTHIGPLLAAEGVDELGKIFPLDS